MSYTTLEQQDTLSVSDLHFSGVGSSGTRLSSPMAKALTDSRFSTYIDAASLKTCQTPSARSSVSFVKRILWALVPSFVQSRYAKEPSKPERLHPTAYLDGMRGVAAFAVFISHAAYQTFDLGKGYGYGDPGENTYLIQLPIVRLIYHGPPMVAIFFIISGYALSYKPLKLMRTQSYESLMNALSSSVFRRGLRLYLPCFASTFVVATLCQLGVFRATQKQFDTMPIPRPDHHAWTAPTPYHQFVDWTLKMFDFVQPFNYFVFAGSVDLDRHLWTIPTEFRASMVLFLTHMLTARLRPAARVGFYALAMYWVLHWNRWELTLFFAGALFAELNMISPDTVTAPLDAPLSEKPSRIPTLSPKTWRNVHLATFLLGLYIASYPEEYGSETPGYRFLGRHIPGYIEDRMRFWPIVGALLIVGATTRCPALRAPFTLAPVQYLGRISFALYLVHGPVIHTFGYAIMPGVYERTGSAPRWRFEAGFAVVLALITLVVVWAADIFWRVVDMPCVRFARWLEDRLVVRLERPPPPPPVPTLSLPA